MDPKVLKMMQGAAGGGPNDKGWQPLLCLDRNKENANWQGATGGADRLARFGGIGSSDFLTRTAVNTGAENRTAIGDGDGLYNAFFEATGITHIAIVWSAVAQVNNSSLFDLATLNNSFAGGTTLGFATSLNTYASTKNVEIALYTLRNGSSYGAYTKSIYETLKDIDSAFGSMNDIGGNDSFVNSNYNSKSTNNPTRIYSGDRTWSSTNFNIPQTDYFCTFGINIDSDNDAQAFCFYSGSLQSGKGDSWRGDSPHTTFWSLWGHDFNGSTNTSNRMSSSRQGFPGTTTNNQNGNTSYAANEGTLYVLGFVPS